MKSNKKFGSFGKKGYYIALILCAAAIGITGYVYYRNTNQTSTPDPSDTPDISVVSPSVEDVPAGGTEPDGNIQVNQPDNDPAEEPVLQELKTCSPLPGNTVMDYAMDCLAYNPTTRDWRVHDGIDIAAEEGATVCAAAAGTVYTTYTDELLGAMVVIRHQDGYVTVYSSLDAQLLVEPGDEVEMGQAIGTVGNTALMETAIGDHLHFSVTCNGESMDPQAFIDME